MLHPWIRLTSKVGSLTCSVKDIKHLGVCGFYCSPSALSRWLRSSHWQLKWRSAVVFSDTLFVRAGRERWTVILKPSFATPDLNDLSGNHSDDWNRDLILWKQEGLVTFGQLYGILKTSLQSIPEQVWLVGVPLWQTIIQTSPSPHSSFFSMKAC